MKILVVCGDDRAYAATEADALFAARTLRRDEHDALGSQGSGRAATDFFLLDDQTVTHLLHVAATATI